MDTCFMCESIATTVDHIPPKCLFPERKDVGIDYRKNLITVPACKVHNLSSSMDDEYLMAIIAFHWRNNQIASKQSMTKIIRALQRNKHYYDLFFLADNNKFVVWNNEALVFTSIDIDRFRLIMDKISRGIYYHHFESKWLGDILIQPLSLAITHNKAQALAVTDLMEIVQQLNLLCSAEPKHGANPDIFYYQIIHDCPPMNTLIRLVFYEGFELIANLSNNPWKNS
jgi:hypothetical protein